MALLLLPPTCYCCCSLPHHTHTTLCLQSWSLMWASPRATRSRSSSGGTGSSSNADAAAACGALSLTARQVNLKQQQQQRGGSSSTSSSMCFVDLCLAPCLPGQPVGSNGVYALTDKGSLLLLRSTGRTVDRSINLQVRVVCVVVVLPAAWRAVRTSTFA